MEFEGLTIDSKFLCVAPNDWAVVAKFSIIINGNSFEYSQSPHWLSQQYDKLNTYYSQSGNEWIVDAVKKAKSCITNQEGKWIVEAGNKGRYSVDVTEDHWTKFFSDLSNLKLTMTEEEQLFALRCVLQDALVLLEFSTEEEFIKCMGYDGDYKSIMKSIRVYNQCKDTFFKLRLGDSQIRSLLDKLSEQGIE